MTRVPFLLAVLAVPLLAGCGSASYYWQGIRGEMDILERSAPIPAVVETTQDAALKAKLVPLGVECTVRHNADYRGQEHPDEAMQRELVEFFTRQIAG